MEQNIKNNIDFIEGGVCAPTGFFAAGLHAGFKKRKKDLAVVFSQMECSAAAVYTTNKVKGASLLVTKKHLKNGRARAIVCNSGNANTCAPGGRETAEKTCVIVADSFEIDPTEVIVCSTGVIGLPLPMEPFYRGIPKLAGVIRLGDPGHKYYGSHCAAEAIMTTDKVVKEVAVALAIGKKTYKIGGIAKGSGMINPRMATMLAFLTTDANLAPDLLQKLLRQDVDRSFNQISVDGDTSTNDTVAILANGAAGGEPILENTPEAEAFSEALNAVTTKLSRMLARDGEGATKLIECAVAGAPDDAVAHAVAKTVIQSDLVKTAIFGADANWGRVLCAVGYTKGHFNVDRVNIHLGSRAGIVSVCEGSAALPFDEELAKKILDAEEIRIDVDLHDGPGAGRAYGCDLTYGYVKINGMYRT